MEGEGWTWGLPYGKECEAARVQEHLISEVFKCQKQNLRPPALMLGMS